MAIKSYSTTPGSNNSASPNGAPEGMAPSGVNDTIRQIMADIRSDYDGREWRDWGHTVTYASATTFTIPTDVTSIYTTDRPIRCTDATTLYGKVSSSSYGAPNTTVTVVLDSGNLSASLSAVALGVDPSTISISSKSIRTNAMVKWLKGADVASAASLALGTDGNYFDITGTTTVTSIATTGTIGAVVKLHFDGALILTHHATDLILPSGLNITTAAGDEVEFVEYASGDFRCTSYTRASGAAIAGGTLSNQTFTSSGTYTVPAGVTTAVVTAVGGGGGGGGGGNTGFGSGANGTAGGNTTFGALVTAAGGSAGAGGTDGGGGGTGGAGGAKPSMSYFGRYAAGGTGVTAGASSSSGGNGAAVPSTHCDFSTGGTGTAPAAGGTAGSGTYGGGGGGGGADSNNVGIEAGGGGGGSGAIVYRRPVTVTPGDAIAVTIGAGGPGGAAAAGVGSTGGTGGDGWLVVEWAQG